MGMRQQTVIRTTCMVCALSLITVVSAADPLDMEALRFGIVPGADLVVSVDAAGWNQTPIQEKVNAIKDELTAAGLGPEALELKEMVEETLAALGIAEEDLGALVISAHVQGITEAEIKPTSAQQAFQQLGLVLSFSLAKPITTARVKSALNGAAVESGLELMYEKGTYNGAETLSVVVPEEAAGGPPKIDFPKDLLLALVAGGKAGYIGFGPQVKAAVDRAVSGQAAELTDAMSKARTATIDGALSYLLFVPGDSMRAMARARGTQMQQQNPMMAGAVQAFGGLEYLVLGAAGSDTIKARMSAKFSEAQQAGQIKSVVDIMLLGMVKMMVVQSLGRSIPLLDSLASNQTDSTISVDATMTEDDFKALMELQAKSQPMQPAPALPAPN